MKNQKISEIEKLKSLSFKEKIEYFWDYYRFLAIGIVLVLAIISSIVFSAMTNISPLFSCYAINLVSSEPEKLQIFQEDIANELGFEHIEHFLFDTTSIVDLENSDASFEHVMRLSTHLAASEIDSVIGDNGILHFFGQSGGLLNLETQVSPHIYETYKDNIVSVELTSDGSTIPCAIDISDSPFIQFINPPLDKPFYFAIPANSKDIETAEKLLDIIFSYPN